MVITEDKQINIIALCGDREFKFDDVSCIMFDGRDAVIKMRERCTNQHMRLFDSMVVTVVDRKEPIKEEVRCNYFFTEG